MWNSAGFALARKDSSTIISGYWSKTLVKETRGANVNDVVIKSGEVKVVLNFRQTRAKSGAAKAADQGIYQTIFIADARHYGAKITKKNTRLLTLGILAAVLVLLAGGVTWGLSNGKIPLPLAKNMACNSLVDAYQPVVDAVSGIDMADLSTTAPKFQSAIDQMRSSPPVISDSKVRAAFDQLVAAEEQNAALLIKEAQAAGSAAKSDIDAATKAEDKAIANVNKTCERIVISKTD